MPPADTVKTSSKRQGPSISVEPFLFLVLEGARLAAGGLRVALASVDELTVGRGDTRALRRTSPVTRRLDVPDEKMSTAHAQLVRRSGALIVRDLGSTNGTVVNGEPVTEVALHDGDVLELGQTHFTYREILDEDARTPAGDLDPGPADLEPVGFATLDPLYAKSLARLVRVAASSLSTMLLGETGTGKEVIARALHRASERSGPFVAVNCGAIPPNLVEAHLFGHVKGSFTGAMRDEPGVIRAANGGTLLLDEIGDLPSGSQAALLRVLQEGEVVPVGGTRPVEVDVRIVAATHSPLESMAETGGFRRDLYARLAGFVFAVPPLRERMVDFGLLVAALVSGTPARSGGAFTALRLHREAARAMLRYDWPMNVRELEQCLRASSVLAEDGLVAVRDLPAPIAAALKEDRGDELSSDEQLRRELMKRLTETRGNVSEVARLMGKARQQIQRWLGRFDLDPQAFR